ncbi:reverse transcriptase [Caerostris extrusa]|uniref:Reverse transcriptase n=1 Tax=Caerostris extrusa TaxID=172846 RepID=A0AAV4RPP6_CAEEX|nr:reverse transcriptase [Caerostris extrusa]
MADAKNGTAYVDFWSRARTIFLQNVEPISPVLGLQWDRIEDSLFIPFKSEPIADLSKRKLLSIVHSVFDPLVSAKLILQEAWATEANWDSPLPDELQSRFSTWYHGLSYISQLKFERCIGYGKRDSLSLHIFCYASKNAYATVIFLRSESSRLAKYVVTVLSLKEVPTYYWADATVALCWIQREENWGVLVNNRVKEIRSLSKKEYWRHIPGKLNTADIASRGCTLQHLSQYGWWEGPEF